MIRPSTIRGAARRMSNTWPAFWILVLTGLTSSTATSAPTGTTQQTSVETRPCTVTPSSCWAVTGAAASSAAELNPAVRSTIAPRAMSVIPVSSDGITRDERIGAI